MLISRTINYIKLFRNINIQHYTLHIISHLNENINIIRFINKDAIKFNLCMILRKHFLSQFKKFNIIIT